MLPLVQQNELELFREMTELKKRRKVTQRFSKSISQETRLVPGLIFQIEAFERSVLTICNQLKVTIVKSFHRSTARDFRVQLDELETALEQMDKTESSEEENSNIGDLSMTIASNNE